MKIMKQFVSNVKFAIKNIYERPSIKFNFDYDAYWESKRGLNSNLSVFQKTRADIICNSLNNDDRVLDIGSGDGSIALYISRKVKCSILCTDFSEKSLALMNELGLEACKKSIFDDFSNLIANEGINTITILEVLEHITEPEERLLFFLKHAEKVIFSVPNSGFISHRIRLLLGKFPMQWRLNPSEHLRFWTLSDMRWWLRELNITNYQIKCYEGIPLFNKIFPALFSRGMIVIIAR